ncbi:uncharacterized protein CTRU02_202841 [Colletotrichum truncatum]|uniref:Uncharacterized protein n=1 Tax=Colletotrichum truncatum TaxID=5467 RepID=A0ACC3ZLC9_COLTU|nr:uncharacterized protein CTRU02_12936 [Colletotrichum truncatum]KAF6783919.1 hypothetical protein CTRU02_12936 [Colletotrichum truncatum]
MSHEYNKELRPLGLLERYSTARSHLGIYNNVCVTAVYKYDNSGNLRQKLCKAVDFLLGQHPILSATPVDIHTESPRFVLLPSIDFGRLVTLRETTTPIASSEFELELEALLETQHNKPFKHDENLSPFWRLEVWDNRAISQSFLVCLCFHHSLMDTKSALVFHEDLQQALNQTLPKASQQSELLPSLESVYHLPISEAFKETVAQNDLPANIWSGAPQRVPVQTRIRLFWVSEKVGDTFRRRCKREGASLTAGIMALLAATFFKVLPEQYDTLQGDCAVSLRHLLPPPIDDRSLGCYVGSFSEKYSRKCESVWSDARRTKETIDEVGNRKGADMPVGYLQHVSEDISGWLSVKVGKKRAAAWELSNVGVVSEAQSDGPIELERVLFSQSASACSGAVKVSVVTGRDKRPGFCFSWQEGIVQEDLAEEIVSSFRELLESVDV